MDVKNRTNFVAMLLIAATLLFVIFNWSTTLDTLVAIFGPSFAVKSFAVAVAAIDFAGLSRMFVARKSEEDDDDDSAEEPGLRSILLFVWLIAALGDIFLTWLWGAIQSERNAANVALSESLVSSARFIAPIVVAIAEAAIRIPLVIALSSRGESWFYRPKYMQRAGKRPRPNYASSYSPPGVKRSDS